MGQVGYGGPAIGTGCISLLGEVWPSWEHRPPTSTDQGGVCVVATAEFLKVEIRTVSTDSVGAFVSHKPETLGDSVVPILWVGHYQEVRREDGKLHGGHYQSMVEVGETDNPDVPSKNASRADNLRLVSN